MWNVFNKLKGNNMVKAIVFIDFVSERPIEKKALAELKTLIEGASIKVTSMAVGYKPVFPPPYLGNIVINFDEPKSGMFVKLEPKITDFFLRFGTKVIDYIYLCPVPPDPSGPAPI